MNRNIKWLKRSIIGDLTALFFEIIKCLIIKVFSYVIKYAMLFYFSISWTINWTHKNGHIFMFFILQKIGRIVYVVCTTTTCLLWDCDSFVHKHTDSLIHSHWLSYISDDKILLNSEFWGQKWWFLNATSFTTILNTGNVNSF